MLSQARASTDYDSLAVACTAAVLCRRRAEFSLQGAVLCCLAVQYTCQYALMATLQ